MPKLISYTPGWLSRPSPGFDLFTKTSDGKGSILHARQTADQPNNGPCRLIAHRGSEIFTVVGNNGIRWADLAVLKDEWEAGDRWRPSPQSPTPNRADDESSSYRVLKVTVHEPIRQIVISPNGRLLAIATSHTVHVAVLPASSRLAEPDSTPLKLQTFTLGPTVHVLSQARVASLLWHPLGVNGDCLVTVTADAVVRLWELNTGNRWSFDTPGLAVDLRKLRVARSAEDDLTADSIGYNKGFSLESLGMEASAATFGGNGSDEESGWSAMTLFVAMSEGDVYALCPLLPAKWQPPVTFLPTLSATTTSRKAYLESTSPPAEKPAVIEEQIQWLSELDREEPRMVAGRDEFAPKVAIYNRPQSLSAFPRLQGPFRIMPGDMEDMIYIVDIHVIAPKMDAEELVDDEELFDVEDSRGLSMPIINLLTSGGTVYVCLSLDAVEAQWLPFKKPHWRASKVSTEPAEMHILSIMDTLPDQKTAPSEQDWPMFTPDINSRHAFFVTHRRAIYFLSLDYWIDTVSPELEKPTPQGTDLRLSILFESPEILRERMFRFEKPKELPHLRPISAPIIIQDSDLGYFLLTLSADRPYAAILDSPATAADVAGPLAALTLGDDAAADDEAHSAALAPRLAYQPPEALYSPIPLDFDRAPAVARFSRSSRGAEIRLSSATLEALADAHRRLSAATHVLGGAVADLFTRGHRLPAEFAEQRRRVADLGERIDKVCEMDEDEDEDEDEVEDEDDDDAAEREGGRDGDAPVALAERMRRVDEKQEELRRRQEQLKKKLARVSVRPLADQEKLWAEEVDGFKSSVLPEREEENPDSGAEDSGDETEQEVDDGGSETQSRQRRKVYRERYEEARQLARDLLEDLQDVKEESQERPSTARRERESSETGLLSVPADVRKKRVGRVMQLLDRETALVNAAQARLQRLGITSASAS